MSILLPASLQTIRSPAYAEGTSTVNLGAAGTYSVLAGTAVTIPNTELSGDLGVSPGTEITGTPSGTFNGTKHVNDDHARQAQLHLLAAYDDARDRTPTRKLDAAGAQLGEQTFTAGVYHSDAAFGLTGALTLDGQGDPNAVFIFQTDAALNTAAASIVNLTNGAKASHVFWQVYAAATLGASSTFKGTIMARVAITVGAGTEVEGSALAITAAVTLGDNTTFTSTAPSGGSLTATTVGATLTEVRLNGTSTQYATGTSTQWTITDARGTGAAWTLSVSATVPTSAAGTVEQIARTLPIGNLTITPGPLTADTGADPVGSITAPALTLSGSTQTLVSTKGPNKGIYTLTPKFSLAVPANAYRSNWSDAIDDSNLNPYISTLTVTIG